MEHKFRNRITLDVRILTDCQKKIDKTRFYKLFKMLSESISADNMHPENMDGHDKYFEPRTEAEKDFWNSCRQLAKQDMINFIKSTNGGIKSAEIRKQKKQKEEKEDKDISKTETTTAPAQKPVRGAFVPPTEKEVLEYAKQMNSIAGMGGFMCSRQTASAFFDNYNRQDWFIGNGNHMTNWKSGLRLWAKKEEQKLLEQ